MIEKVFVSIVSADDQEIINECTVSHNLVYTNLSSYIESIDCMKTLINFFIEQDITSPVKMEIAKYIRGVIQHYWSLAKSTSWNNALGMREVYDWLNDNLGQVFSSALEYCVLWIGVIDDIVNMDPEFPWLHSLLVLLCYKNRN